MSERREGFYPARRAVPAMAVATAFSRLTGLIRTAVLAAALGVTGLADAYNTANTVPMMLLMLVTGGTLTSVLIPMLTKADGDEECRERAAVAGGAILAVTLLASLVVGLFAPVIMRGFALVREEQQSAAFVSVGSRWLLLFAPQILLYGLSVFATSVLNSRGRLALAASASIVANVFTIVAVGAYLMIGAPQPPSLTALRSAPLIVLGVGTTAGVAAMAGIQYWGARRMLPGLGIRLDLRHPVIHRLRALGGWTFLYVAVNQIGLAIVIALANSVTGGVAAYQWGFAIMQLPFALIAVSVFSAIYPRLTVAAGSRTEFQAQFSRGLRFALLFLIPSAALVAVLAVDLSSLVVGYGAARGSGALFVADMVKWFALALIPFTVFQLLTRSFYALEDTRAPALANVALNAVFVLGSLGAFSITSADRSRVAGLVVSYGLSYFVGVLALALVLARRRKGVFSGLASFGLRSGAATAVMSVVVGFLASVWGSEGDQTMVLIRVLVLGLTGVAVYSGVCLALRVRELRLIANAARGSLTGN